MKRRKKIEIHDMYLILSERKVGYVLNKCKKTPEEEKEWHSLFSKIEALSWVLNIKKTKEP